ncbi:hypothetical protein [Paraburkholderia tagetis]|uniref:Uncharacterized protein n=1 Tax=Paraburkholderia tagetis TaxID=2913261 RepID=A0A9X1RW44_9BURK|nr:hypothetical protein [Paraburkholderia tagetis]MCG5077211.1 hypothetical protein [Paraburkholderia tagetis]
MSALTPPASISKSFFTCAYSLENAGRPPLTRITTTPHALRHLTLRGVVRGSHTVNLLSQIIIITSFITRAGHGQLDIADIERVEHGLGEVLNQADHTGVWNVPESLIDGLTAVVNEYDRALSVTRMEIVVRASDYLGKLVGRVAHDTRTNDSHLQVAR